MDHAIEISHLHKTFRSAHGRSVKAVDDLSFVVKKGELFAFLGVNGAGKSTTISILCGTLAKDEGNVTVAGEDIDKTRRYVEKLGVVFQNSVLDAALTVTDNLKNRAALYGIVGEAFEKRLSELSALLSFEDILTRTVGKLSGGQKRRIDIARALLHRPEILILDEPTTGLDPQTRKLLWDVIRSLRENENLTVFLTTHYMEEAADADYIVILDSGKIAAKGTPLTLKDAFVHDYILLYHVDETTVKGLEQPYTALRDGFRIEIDSPMEATALITKYPDIFKDYEVIKGKMDDVFLAVTGKSLEGGEKK